MDDVSTSSSPGEPAPRRRRGRRPAAEVRAEVLSAAADLLFDDGTAAVTFERVSVASGASKTTLYKWWPSPGALAVEAYFDRVEEALEFPDTGDLEADLRGQLLAFTHLMTHDRAGQVVRELIGAAQGDPALRTAFAASYGRPRRDAAVQVLARARDRGQLREDAPLDVLVDQLWGACYHRLLVLDEDLPPELVDRLIRNALHGAAPAGGPARGAGGLAAAGRARPRASAPRAARVRPSSSSGPGRRRPDRSPAAASARGSGRRACRR